MRIYITGIAGMLGANLAYELRSKYEIIGSDIVPIDMQNVMSHVLDLTDYSLLEDNIKEAKPDVVIHTVAAVNVDLCEKDPIWAEKMNYHLTKKIANICDQYHIKLIYISTDAVFDGHKADLYDEECITNPINVYGKTKLKGEYAVRKIQNSIILRTNIYGFNIQDKYSFGEWILYSLMKDEQLRMFTDVKFSPILVNELAKIIDLVIEQKISGTYHATGTGSISKYEFATVLKNKFGLSNGTIIPSLSSSCELLAKRANNMGLSNGKIAKELGISISSPIQSIDKFKEMYDNGFPETLKKMR